jgi:hypothetical protein
MKLFWIIIGICVVIFIVWVEYIRPHIGNEENTPPPAPPSKPKPQGIWKEITGGELPEAGESLFHEKEFSVNHMLYGATENKGKVVKFNGINWTVDFDTENKGHKKWCNSYHLGENGQKDINIESKVKWLTLLVLGGVNL